MQTDRPLPLIRLVRPALAAAIVITAGCGDRQLRPDVEVRDSAGVVIVESSDPMWDDAVAWEVDSVPRLDLSRSGAGPAYEFYRVRDATRLADGSIVVANEGTSEVRRYDQRGIHHLSVGGQGEGPGEFWTLTSVHRYRGDSLAVLDRRQRRITILDEAGSVGRTVALVSTGGPPNEIGTLEDGRFILDTNALDVLELHHGRVRIPKLFVLLTPTGEAGDTLATMAGTETFVYGTGDARVLFGKHGHFALHDDLLVLGDAEEMEYRIRDLAGVLRRIVRIPDYPLEITQAERDSAVAAMRAWRPPPRLARLPNRLIEALPDRRPAFADLIVDSERHVWLGEFAGAVTFGDERMWLVFDPAGVWLGTIPLPAQLEPYEIGPDYLLGRWENEAGVESIRLLTLRRNE